MKTMCSLMILTTLCTILLSCSVSAASLPTPLERAEAQGHCVEAESNYPWVTAEALAMADSACVTGEVVGGVLAIGCGIYAAIASTGIAALPGGAVTVAGVLLMIDAFARAVINDNYRYNRTETDPICGVGGIALDDLLYVMAYEKQFNTTPNSSTASTSATPLARLTELVQSEDYSDQAFLDEFKSQLEASPVTIIDQLKSSVHSYRSRLRTDGSVHPLTQARDQALNTFETQLESIESQLIEQGYGV